MSFFESLSGSYPRPDVFRFRVFAVTSQPLRAAKSILKALTDDKSENLNITTVNPQNAKLTLDFLILIANKRSAFKALMGL